MFAFSIRLADVVFASFFFSFSRNTAPGGWAEFQDWEIGPRPNDEPFADDNAFVRVAELMTEACLKAGRDPSPGPKLKGWMEGAGFKNVRHENFLLPLGMWPKDKKMVTRAFPMIFWASWLTFSPLPPSSLHT